MKFVSLITPCAYKLSLFQCYITRLTDSSVTFLIRRPMKYALQREQEEGTAPLCWGWRGGRRKGATPRGKPVILRRRSSQSVVVLKRAVPVRRARWLLQLLSSTGWTHGFLQCGHGYVLLNLGEKSRYENWNTTPTKLRQDIVNCTLQRCHQINNHIKAIVVRRRKYKRQCEMKCRYKMLHDHRQTPLLAGQITSLFQNHPVSSYLSHPL